MKFLLFSWIACFFSVVSPGQNSTDERLVKKVILSFQDDFNEGSFKHAARYTTPDWEHINPGGGITKGRAEVLNEVRGVHQSFLKGVSMTVERMAIRFVTPNVAIANVIHKISTYELPVGVKHEHERQQKTYILVKQRGNWLLTHDQNTVIACRSMGYVVWQSLEVVAMH